MKFKIFDKESLDVAIIACGDTGQSIGGGIIQELKTRKVKVKSLAISSKIEDHKFANLFDNLITIDDKVDGFAKKIDDAIEGTKNRSEDLNKALKKLLGKSFEGLVLLTTGPGATGLGSTLIIIDILLKEFKITPPVLTLLPEIFENSRVQFNTAYFLYEVEFKSGAPRNPLILLDNKPSLKEMDMCYSEVSDKRIQTIPTAIADLLIAGFEKSISEEFDAHVDDLFEVMHTPGVSVFVAEDLGGENEGADSSRIEDVISDSVIDTTSLTKDKVFEARNAFVAIFNLNQTKSKLSLQTEFETRKLYREFTETSPFVKFIPQNIKSTTKSNPKLRAIIAGLPIPTRILQIMRIAQDSRKKVIIDERSLQYDSIDLGIDRVISLENQNQSLFGPDRAEKIEEIPIETLEN